MYHLICDTRVERKAELSLPGVELDQVLGEEAGQTWQLQANSDSLLGMSGFGPYENGLQLPPPEELQPHPGGNGEHGI